MRDSCNQRDVMFLGLISTVFKLIQSLNAHPGINVIFDGIVMDVNDSFHQMHRFQLMLL